MWDQDSLRQVINGHVQGALLLNIAYLGLATGALQALENEGGATVERLAARTGRDPGYLQRWADSAYAFELLDQDRNGAFRLTDVGRRFLPGAQDSFMPAAVQAVLSAHMTERAAELSVTGERPGESVLGERAGLLPWFGPMLEAGFVPLLTREILPGVAEFAEMDRKGGLALDLGCGNGWYLRRLLAQYPNLRGIGLDAIPENIEQAQAAAEGVGLAARLEFRRGDLHYLQVDEPADLIAMNRALHHVWESGTEVFDILHRQLRPGGIAVIWEPNWPADRRQLREPAYRPMAFQNLAEYIQGNHFLRPEEIQAQFEQRGMRTRLYTFAGGREAVVVARR